MFTESAMYLLDRSKIALAFIALAVILIGCKTKQVEEQNTKVFGQKSPSPGAYYVHCETCNWCKGTFKTTQDAERVSRDHNIQKHDYFKVAYYDDIKCKR